MKMLKGWIPTASILVAVLMLGTSFANAGVITTGATGDEPTPCTETTKTNWGVITTGITGVITTGFTGVITTGFTGVITTGFTGVITTGFKDSPVDCGVITTG